MSKLQKRSPSGSSTDNTDADGKVAMAGFAAFTTSAAGLIGILTATENQTAGTIVALALFGALGLGSLILGAIYLRRRR
ncbi:hypothetical protein [Actinoplanes aureus]|uniref:Uncharacterized protein n=1 Tax=Actinoplanes aureus TaxID=2792083 RepID=A0A931BZY9_9ACTN|nr:hypothetical protein [Actinoplanes aureus]MBG0560709.1 hypothetical protein [Actinoplanes aureus]